MASRSRSCKNHPDSFCYICGEFKIIDERNRVFLPALQNSTNLMAGT